MQVAGISAAEYMLMDKILNIVRDTITLNFNVKLTTLP